MLQLQNLANDIMEQKSKTYFEFKTNYVEAY